MSNRFPLQTKAIIEWLFRLMQFLGFEMGFATSRDRIHTLALDANPKMTSIGFKIETWFRTKSNNNVSISSVI